MAFESKTPALITWKFYLGVSIGVAIFGAFFNISGGYPLPIILFNICGIVLLFLGVIYLLNFLFQKSEEKNNFRLFFEDHNLRVIWKKKKVIYSYSSINYRTNPEIIDDDGKFSFLTIDSPEFVNTCDMIILLDTDENEFLKCNLNYMEQYKTFCDRIHTFITPWKHKPLSSEKVFHYRKIPLVATILSIILYILSIGMMIVWIETDFIMLGSLTGALFLFTMDSAIFSLFTFLCYTAAIPGRFFPIKCSEVGILFHRMSNIIPWEQINIYYFGLQRPKLRIQSSEFSIDFNPAWVKKYSEFVKTLKPHQQIRSFKKEKGVDSDTPRKFRFNLRRGILSSIRTYKIFFALSTLLFLITSGLFIAAPLLTSLQGDYYDEMVFESSNNVVELFNLSTPIDNSFNWFFEFSLTGNLEAFEVELAYQSERSYFSNFTTGLISVQRSLQLNHNTVFNEGANLGILLSNNSQEYSRWRSSKRDLSVEWFFQGLNTANLTIDLTSNFQPNQSEEGVLNLSITEVMVIFSALKTGDGIPEATKLFPGFNAYMAQFFTFLSLIPFAGVIDMRLRKPKLKIY